MRTHAQDAGERRSGEFELIGRLLAALDAGASADDVVVGPGDDCAAVRIEEDRTALYTTDTLVAGVHFVPDQIAWRDLGWKAITVNLSDISAMGGRPLHALVTVGVPDDFASSDLEEAYRGISDACARYGAQVVGGDVVRSPALFITVAMTGEAVHEDAGGPMLLLRSAARAGDVVAVTGDLGASAGGQRALAEGLEGRAAESLKKRHARPRPRVAEGQRLAALGVRAAIDVSDGTVADLRHLCEASGVAATVRADSLPVSDDLRTLFPDDWRDLALSGGEDYELLFTALPEVAAEASSALDVPVTVIGNVEPLDGATAADVRVIDGEGRTVETGRGGWDHLSA